MSGHKEAANMQTMLRKNRPARSARKVLTSEIASIGGGGMGKRISTKKAKKGRREITEGLTCSLRSNGSKIIKEGFSEGKARKTRKNSKTGQSEKIGHVEVEKRGKTCQMECRTPLLIREESGQTTIGAQKDAGDNPAKEFQPRLDHLRPT